MRPSQILRSGGGADPLGKYNRYIGGWGNLGTPVQKQRGIITYGITPNRQNPLAGAAHDAVFNVWRRFSSQILYFAPPFITAYYIMKWAVERNEYLNSKAGRAECSDQE